MTKLNDLTQLRLNVNHEFNLLEEEITKRIHGVLENLIEERTVGVSFDKHNFQMKIYIDNREYEIGVQGRGTDIDKYLTPMLDIIKQEFSIPINNKNKSE